MTDLHISRIPRPVQGKLKWNVALLAELAASVVVALLIWGIGVVGMGIVWLEGVIIAHFGVTRDAISASGVNGIFLILTAPLLLGVMSYLLVKWSHSYKGPAELIPLLKESSSDFPGWVRASITWVIACIELGSGLSPKGFEGPYIAAAGGLGGWFATKVSLDAAARRRLARCGLGVAFGVLFHATLGGFVCTFEFGGFERDEFRRLLPPAIVATVVSWVLTGTPAHLPGSLMPGFLITTPETNLNSDVLLHLLLVGVACGIAGIGYTHAIRVSKRLFGRLEQHTYVVLIPVVGACLSTVLGALFPVIIGNNELSRAIAQTRISVLPLQGSWAPVLLFGAIIAKIMATASADGSKCAGGTVGPAILLGGLVGRFIGGISNTVFAATGSAAIIGPTAGLTLTMFVTVAQWSDVSLASFSLVSLPRLAVLLVELALPLALAKAICWRTGTELYPYAPTAPAASGA